MLKNIKIEGDVFSMESYLERLNTVTKVLPDGLSEYVMGFGTSIGDYVQGFSSGISNDATKKAIEHKHRASAAVLKLDVHDLADIMVIVPESFKGNLFQYTRDLRMAYDDITPKLRTASVKVSADLVRLNEGISDDQVIVDRPTSLIATRELQNSVNNQRKNLSKYFPVEKAASVSVLADVVTSPEQIESLYDELISTGQTFESIPIDEINELNHTLVELSEVYAQNLQNSHVKIDGNKALKDVAESLYSLSRGFEFYGYLQASLLQLNRTLADIGEKIK